MVAEGVLGDADELGVGLVGAEVEVRTDVNHRRDLKDIINNKKV